jgi:hypothetical protein
LKDCLDYTSRHHALRLTELHGKPIYMQEDEIAKGEGSKTVLGRLVLMSPLFFSEGTGHAIQGILDRTDQHIDEIRRDDMTVTALKAAEGEFEADIRQCLIRLAHAASQDLHDRTGQTNES